MNESFAISILVSQFRILEKSKGESNVTDLSSQT